MDTTVAGQAQRLRSKAAQCRRLASTTADRREAEMLSEMARQCDERATHLEPLHRVAQRQGER
jgi:hypothetical protein